MTLVIVNPFTGNPLKLRPVATRERVHRVPLKALPDPADAMESIRRRTTLNKATGCWEWAGVTNRFGYAQAFYGNKRYMAHRLAALAAFGQFDPMLQVCHRCDNRKCCNPAHLFLGTRRDNERDKVAKGRHQNVRKTHCVRGHELAGENIAIRMSECGGVKRVCRTCERERARLQWRRQRASSSSDVTREGA